MSEEKIVGYKVKFNIGKRFRMKVYMTKDYYDVWKNLRDAAIKDVWVEEVELEQSYFIS
ncbi:hypothetical protein P4H66_26765 [Paenibacillus dokdonensis]|uniref:Uncharacterized protein n=1 Tax=Paenibacillus dokdonensis TaxID=2567944 RepID=A0ABU6GUN7_9BACL|nr:hypothetical protein [Paenibacillus dokdonensis]MEC0243423.1 hypothetical protein [Paenibacillus dokdonensis]